MNLGFSEMAFIFLLALIIFGPKKLPEIGRQIGKALAEFRRASNEFKWQLEAEMRQIEAEANRAAQTKPSTQPALSAAAAAPPAGSNGEAENVIHPKLPEAEIYPTTFGLEFRSKATAGEGSGELINPERAVPEQAKGTDA